MKLKQLAVAVLMLNVMVQPVQANTPKILEFERNATNELGFEFNILMGDERVEYLMIDGHGFTDELFALEAAKRTLTELKRYNQDLLRKMNLSFRIMERDYYFGVAGQNVEWQLANEYRCYIDITFMPSRGIEDSVRTIHHELFHCYDHAILRNKEALVDWVNTFNLSEYVKANWGKYTEQYEDPIELAKEERAEYYVATIRNDFSEFNGKFFAKDTQLEAKKAKIKKDVEALLGSGNNTPKEKYMLRTWENGKISEIKFYEGDVMLTRFYFDHDSGFILIEDGLTGEYKADVIR